MCMNGSLLALTYVNPIEMLSLNYGYTVAMFCTRNAKCLTHAFQVVSQIRIKITPRKQSLMFSKWLSLAWPFIVKNQLVLCWDAVLITQRSLRNPFKYEPTRTIRISIKLFYRWRVITAVTTDVILQPDDNLWKKDLELKINHTAEMPQYEKVKESELLIDVSLVTFFYKLDK